LRHKFNLFIIISFFLGVNTLYADTLSEVIGKAIRTNPEVLAAISNRDATEKELDNAKAGRYPTLDIKMGSGSERTHTRTIDTDSFGRQEFSIQAKQLLFDGGAVSGEIDRQRARLQSLDSKVFDVSDSVAQRVADIYLEVLKNQEIYDLAKNNLESHQDYLEKIRERANAGIATAADLQLAQGRAALASSTLAAKEASLDDAKFRYKRLVGEMPRNLVKPSTIAQAIPDLVELANEISINNNASLKVSAQDTLAAKEAEKAARARFMPTVTLEAGATRNRNIDGIAGRNQDNTLMMMMNYNLFRGGADKAKVEEYSARYNAAIESENNIKRMIEEEVGRAWVARKASKISLDFYLESAAKASSVKEAYKAQYDIGKRTLLDLMNTESEMFQAKSALISGTYTVEQSEYRLLAVMGGILKLFNMASPTEIKVKSEKSSLPDF
jgi:adhesin transport system outer membrane protein